MIRKLTTSCLVLILGYGMVKGQTAFSWPPVTQDNQPWVRWWWPGNAVDTTGIGYNLQEFHQAGIGGVEITPIYGTKGFENKFIDYLSPEWMKMLHFTINEAAGMHMGVDMATDTGWPFGGPQIPLSDAASKALWQTYTLRGGERLHEVVKANDPRQSAAPLQALMAYSKEGEKIDLTPKVDAKGNLNWTAPAGSWRLVAVFAGNTFQKVKRASPGGEGWVMDHLSAKALQEYLERFSQAFAQSKCPPPHAFFNDSYEVFGADWSKDLLPAFEKNRGYSLKDYLPELMGQGDPDTISRVIADYRQTVSEMLLQHFTTGWTNWAHRMGSVTRNQAHGSPGNLLDLYGTVDIPEIESYGSSHFDIPGLPEDSMGGRPGKLDPLLLKFSSSAAHVMGKKFASSETFTWLGEHFRVSLSQCKPVLDEMWLSGINHVFFHGTPYSPKGAPWPGWQFYASVNFTPYNTIWQDIPAFNQYIARTQSFLQMGKPDNDVLLYWPIQDVWAMHTPEMIYQLTIGNATEWLSPTPFHQIGARLMESGYGFDYISDRQLENTRVVNGALQTPGATYQALVIPPCKYMPLETLQRIASLARAGAKVIFYGDLPEEVPGIYQLKKRTREFLQLKDSIHVRQPSTNINRKDFGKGTVFTGNNVPQILTSSGVQASGFPAAGLSYIRRKMDDGYIFFVSNLHAQGVDAWIPLAKNISSAILFNPYDGSRGKAAVKTALPRGRNTREGGNRTALTSVYLQLKPGQSMIIRGYRDKEVEGDPWHYKKVSGNPFRLAGPWNVTFGSGSPDIGLSYDMDRLVSWTTLSDSARVFAGTATYTLSFTLPAIQADDWMLDLGEVDFSAKVSINGQYAGSLWDVPFEIAIGKYLHPGENELKVSVTNLAANRIADYDRKGVDWKKFYDINVVDMSYKPLDASGWNPVPSGLLGPVTLTPLGNMHP